MSTLPATNGETAKEMLKKAFVAKGTADWNSRQGPEHWEFACRNYVHAAEFALKAVYVKMEQPFERTHKTHELYKDCPTPPESNPLRFTNKALREFSYWYLAPYFLERSATQQDLRDCQRISIRILQWAENTIYDR